MLVELPPRIGPAITAIVRNNYIQKASVNRRAICILVGQCRVPDALSSCIEGIESPTPRTGSSGKADDIKSTQERPTAYIGQAPAALEDAIRTDHHRCQRPGLLLLNAA